MVDAIDRLCSSRCATKIETVLLRIADRPVACRWVDCEYRLTLRDRVVITHNRLAIRVRDYLQVALLLHFAVFLTGQLEREL